MEKIEWKQATVNSEVTTNFEHLGFYHGMLINSAAICERLEKIAELLNVLINKEEN